MKTLLNVLIAINTLYVISNFFNSDVTVFFFPACVYLVAIFLRINHKEFSNLLKSNRYEN